MTATQRDWAVSDLRHYLRSLDDAALRRVADAPLEKWTEGAYCDFAGCRCLLGHAEDWGPLREDPEDSQAGHCPAEGAFHDLCEADGLGTTVSSIRLLAATLLHERETAALRALLGEEVPA